MLKQYTLLTECLSDLKSQNLPAVRKLRLEIELVQLKRLLLNPDLESLLYNDTDSESTFLSLSDNFKNLCKDDCDASMALIRTIKEQLMCQLVMQQSFSKTSQPRTWRRS